MSILSIGESSLPLRRGLAAAIGEATTSWIAPDFSSDAWPIILDDPWIFDAKRWVRLRIWRSDFGSNQTVGRRIVAPTVLSSNRSWKKFWFSSNFPSNWGYVLEYLRTARGSDLCRVFAGVAWVTSFNEFLTEGYVGLIHFFEFHTPSKIRSFLHQSLSARESTRGLLWTKSSNEYEFHT